MACFLIVVLLRDTQYWSQKYNGRGGAAAKLLLYSQRVADLSRVDNRINQHFSCLYFFVLREQRQA